MVLVLTRIGDPIVPRLELEELYMSRTVSLMSMSSKFMIKDEWYCTSVLTKITKTSCLQEVFALGH
ncbi:TPA: hypothetical protein DEP58_03140 [Patescibacteria group bacterium]|nr:hypothetical protein [Patescibacteria group bacterium]